MTRIALQAPDGARAEVYRHGGHVTSWIPAGSQDERLFLSARSAFGGESAIRGGVPVIFPQFAGMGALPKHGFARSSEWSLVRIGTATSGAAEAHLRLTDSPKTRALWPHEFLADLVVRVHGRALSVALTVANRGKGPFTFTGALHTYLRLGNLASASVHGLTGLRYRDSARGGKDDIDDADPLRVFDYIDRVYLGVTSPIDVREPDRNTRVSAAGFPDVVIWNPGNERAAALADMEPQGFRRMLCVEAAVIETPVTLAPGAKWTGEQSLAAL